MLKNDGNEVQTRVKEGGTCLPPYVSEGLSRVGGLSELRNAIPDVKTLGKLTGLFSSVSDPHRLKIMRLLEVNDLCPCLLVDLLGLSDSRISYHLRILEREGITAQRIEGHWRIYSLTDYGRGVLDQLDLLSALKRP